MLAAPASESDPAGQELPNCAHLAAMDAEIYQINVETVPELRRLSELASARGRIVPVAIRVNPDVDAGTHAKISTGMKESKFGIDVD